MLIGQGVKAGAYSPELVNLELNGFPAHTSQTVQRVTWSEDLKESEVMDGLYSCYANAYTPNGQSSSLQITPQGSTDQDGGNKTIHSYSQPFAC
jgi:hypothetical protein